MFSSSKIRISFTSIGQQRCGQAVDEHEAKLGMTNSKVNFALGVPQKAGGGDYGSAQLEYSNGGNPIRVRSPVIKAVDIVAVK